MSSEPERIALTIEDPPDVYEFLGTVEHPPAMLDTQQVYAALVRIAGVRLLETFIEEMKKC
jgi:hypothetical protein